MSKRHLIFDSRAVAMLCALIGLSLILIPLTIPARSLAATSASASPSATSSPGTQSMALAKTAVVDDASITTFLSDAITWYRHVMGENQLVDHPEEVLYYATDLQIGKEVLNLAFEGARAQVALNVKATPAGDAADLSPVLRQMAGKLAEAEAVAAAAKKRVTDLQAAIASRPRAKRAELSAELASAQGEAELSQQRVDSIKATLQYATGLSSADRKSSGILAQIDQLQQAVSTTDKAAKNAAATPDLSESKESQEPSGIIGITSEYFSLRADARALRDSSARNDELSSKIERFRKPAIKLLSAIANRGAELAAQGVGGTSSEIKNRTAEYRQLIEMHNLAIAVVAPFSKQEVQLALYKENLARWQASIDRYSSRSLSSLSIRLVTLFGLLGLVVLGDYVWRHATIRFIKDEERRRQIQQISQPVFYVMIAFVLIVNFATELGSITTIMGFAAAGIAVALQNVILSVAGYFFLIGRFGIRVGDRVQIGTTTGDVISLGMVKLALMELSQNDRQPTGRVVVYSNAVVFQPNGNFFKQAPGMGFVWNEVRLTLAPDCDYRLAEKRVVDAVDEVFSRYRERAQRDFRYMEADLHILVDTPRPQSRLQLTSAALNMIVRYPAEVHNAVQIADEVSRRVLDAIKREPELRLVAPGPANIQAISVAEADLTGAQPAPNGGTQVVQKS